MLCDADENDGFLVFVLSGIDEVKLVLNVAIKSWHTSPKGVFPRSHLRRNNCTLPTYSRGVQNLSIDSSNVSCSETMSNCRPMPGICLGSISKSWSQKREKAAKLQGLGFASLALGGQGGPGGGAEVELHQNGPFLPLGLLHLRLHVPINQLCLHPKPSGYLFQLLLHILRCFFQLLLHIWNSGELRSYLDWVKMSGLGENRLAEWKSYQKWHRKLSWLWLPPWCSFIIILKLIEQTHKSGHCRQIPSSTRGLSEYDAKFIFQTINCPLLCTAMEQCTKYLSLARPRLRSIKTALRNSAIEFELFLAPTGALILKVFLGQKGFSGDNAAFKFRLINTRT